jgi:hypothetical protein
LSEATVVVAGATVVVAGATVSSLLEEKSEELDVSRAGTCRFTVGCACVVAV